MADTTPTSSNKPISTRLLLSSLADFWSVLEPLLLAAAPKSVCEIGIGEGEFTAVLVEFCRRNHCRYSGIDPAVTSAVVQRHLSGEAEFFKHPSSQVLPRLPAQDVYFVDGDHNYYTVLNELKLILQTPGHWPLVILHDVGWPWGRRDHYCAPDAIPNEFRHPFSNNLGVLPGRNELGPGGFTGETSHYTYGAAQHEGGERNGVLTAVEDFLREQPGKEWKLAVVPAVFGLGILCAPEKCAPAVAAQFSRIEASVAPLKELLELLERNRMELFMTYLRQVEQLNTIHREYDKLAKHADSLLALWNKLHENYHELAAHRDSLIADYHALLQRHEALEKTCQQLSQKKQV